MALRRVPLDAGGKAEAGDAPEPACARQGPDIQRIEVVLALHEMVPSGFRRAGHLRAPGGARLANRLRSSQPVCRD